ncbi:MAG TPA: L,D-transpeptidase [Longimicrobiaceae bacterium]|nr:L,D-transpeptidase [Longimicrobiaceae bacterium]
MLSRLLSSVLALGAALVTAGFRPAPIDSAPPAPAVRLEVSLSRRTLTVYRGGRATTTFPVAVGTDAHATPTGAFHIDEIIWNPGWVPPAARWADDATRKAPDEPGNPMTGAKLFFQEPDYYIHGTDAPESIGDAASHGCIRMRTADVVALARLVQEAGGAHRSDAWYAIAEANDDTNHVVRLPDPVSIVIRE